MNVIPRLAGVLLLAWVSGCAARDAIPTDAAPHVPSQEPFREPEVAVRLSDGLGFLQKPRPDSLRVMSYNVNWDSIFDEEDEENHELRTASRGAAFRRIVAEVQPDVVCLQEINPDRDPGQVGRLLAEVLSPQGDQGWHAASARDSVIASRFPVLTEGWELVVPAFPRELAQAAALIDLPEDLFGPLDLYFVCAHFKAGTNYYDILLRQRQADVIIRHIGDAISPGGDIDLLAGTPVVILGDFNVYDSDPARHLTTLLTGDVEHEDRYGPDVRPDWDGTDLADALPSHNNGGEEFYTWRNDSGPFNPGILDRILYSDSALAVANAFVLNTALLSEEALRFTGLRADDVLLDPAAGYYDHLPLVVDFAIVSR